jgi:class 3 adenylate cyclase
MDAAQLIGNRFQIANLDTDLLGLGGMGRVYRAVDLHTGELVAVKALNPEVVTRTPDVLERFVREGEALQPVPALRQLTPGIPDGLADLVYRMLEKDSSQRVPSVRLVGAELEAMQKGRPGVAESRFGSATPTTPPTERPRATPGPPAHERRLVTILVCDAKGPDDLDPEEVLEVMDGAFELLSAPVHRYKSTLAQPMANGIMAFFGAPLAHEDDPERAIRAGLEIIAGAREYAEKLAKERGIRGFNVRVGINTGQVVVGARGRSSLACTSVSIRHAPSGKHGQNASWTWRGRRWVPRRSRPRWRGGPSWTWTR